MLSGAVRGALRSQSRTLPMQTQRRGMAGLNKKNYFVEEWNGRREITEKTFKFDKETVPGLVFMGLAFPGFIYFVMKDELAKKYKKLGMDVEQL